MSVTVSCVEDSPTAVGDSATLTEEAPATAIAVLANDTDPDGGTKLIQSKSDGGSGTVVITGGGTGLTYKPNANFCSTIFSNFDTFTYTLNGGSRATVRVDVTCVDDTLAVNDSKTVTEDAAATGIDVLANDSDVSRTTIQSTTAASHGTVVVITPFRIGLTYKPAANYCGPDSFTYTLTSGSTATVSVSVGCVDDPPVAVDDSASVAEGGSKYDRGADQRHRHRRRREVHRQ